jgi:hypothetical protein
MSSGRTKINRLQKKAIAALLTEPTQELAAEKAGIAARTLQRWLLLPDFQAAYREAQHHGFEVALSKLEAATGKAVDKLVDELAGAKASDRIRAAVAILEHAFRAKDLVEHETRIAELERILAELQADEQQKSTTGSGT